MGKVVGLSTLIKVRRAAARSGRRVVFTNGTFDILHRGHVEYLALARACGDLLIVGLNTDASIRRIKGKGRPINRQNDRAVVLAALQAVNYVCLFGEDTPLRMIRALRPDVLVKGADWKREDIVGSDIVLANGGTIKRIRLTPGRSTTSVIQRIRDGKRQA
jgi:D-beta-D-heptose 7-phosphate kinase/D-beta-D-heptose 1-phosphate adenosyltransferase